MADHRDNSEPPQGSSFSARLAESMRHAMENSRPPVDESPGESLDVDSIQRRWFDSLSQTTDAWLRTPEFLGSLRDYLNGITNGTAGDPQGQRDADNERAQLDSDARSLDLFFTRLHSDVESLAPRSAQLDRRQNKPVAGACDDSASQSVTQQRGVTDCDVVYREGPLQLLHYQNSSVGICEPVLICFALVNRPYILDLNEQRSVVRQLLNRGLDVFLIDWGEPDVDDSLRLEDYVCRFLDHVVQFVCDRTDTQSVNLLGYCMGGTLATMYTALKPHRVRNLILMAAPIDFGTREGLLNVWSDPKYFDVDRLIARFGNCPGEFLRFVFQMMKPVQNFAEKQIRVCDHLDDEQFLTQFAAVERWANDSVAVAGETFREYVKALYQQNSLVEGTFRLGDSPVDLSQIHCPILLMVAEKDHLVPPSSTLSLRSQVSSATVDVLSARTGHVGLAVSARAHQDVWPKAVDWMAAHSTEFN